MIYGIKQHFTGGASFHSPSPQARKNIPGPIGLKVPNLTIVLHGAAIREETGFEEMQALKIHSKMYSSL